MEHPAFFLLLLSVQFGSSLPWLYYFVSQNKTWQDAQSYCRANYIDLANVGSAIAVESVVSGMATAYPGYNGFMWIGLKRRWVWVTGEPLTDFAPWGYPEPNEGNDGAACVLTDYYGWSDWYCSTSHYFFCFDDTAAASSKFVVVKMAKIWTDAQTYCRQHYTDLAIINNTQDREQLLTLYTGGAWIGLISAQWSDYGFSLFRYWTVGPNAETPFVNNCVAMAIGDSGRWKSLECGLQNPFICYGGPQYDSIGLYHFVNEPKTWLEAQSFCREMFTDLATVDSVNDVHDLMSSVDLGYSGLSWIGLERVMTTKWGWSMGNERLSDYFNWDDGCPSGAGQCVVLINNLWRDSDCAITQYFVCYNDSDRKCDPKMPPYWLATLASYLQCKSKEANFRQSWLLDSIWAGTGYIMVNIKMTWQDAQSYCRSSYTDLASIRSPWEQKQLNDLVGKGVYVWVGLFLDTWQWSDQWSHNFRNWATGQPTAGTGDCAAVGPVDSGKWINDNCNVQHPFVCYAPSERVKRKQIIKVQLSSNGKANLNDPSVQAAILHEIKKKLKARGMTKFKLSWRVWSDGNVFQKAN